MTELLTILGLFLFAKIVIALGELRRPATSPDGYFLAGRDVSSWRLFFTFVATNFSAFFFMGFAGAGYRIGLAYYAMIALGTIISAVFFFSVGIPTWRLSRETGALTPPALFEKLTGSRALRLSFLFFSICFTIPYVALQPIGAGYLLSALSEGKISYTLGASAMTGFIAVYVFIGGMRSVVKTDLLQGVLMFLLMGTAAALVTVHYGGVSAFSRVFEVKPDLFLKSGTGGYFDLSKWSSFMLLWFFAVPMFPQLMTRFFIAKDTRSIRQSAVVYAILPMGLFLLPVLIGMMGHIDFPGLEGKAADQILPMVLKQALPSWLVATIMMGALAAFMSTLDSQLLAVSTMVTHDIVRPLRPSLSHEGEVKVGRWVVVILAGIGLALAANPPGTIFEIARRAFAGFALLCPPALAILHLKRVSVSACLAALWVLEFLAFSDVLGLSLKGYLPKDPLLLLLPLSFAILFLGQKLKKSDQKTDAPSA